MLYSPGFVSTKLNGLPKFWPLVISTEQAAYEALCDAGKHSKTFGTFTHALLNEGFVLAINFLEPLINPIFLMDGVKTAEKRIAKRNKQE